MRTMPSLALVLLASCQRVPALVPPSDEATVTVAPTTAKPEAPAEDHGTDDEMTDEALEEVRRLLGHASKEEIAALRPRASLDSSAPKGW